MHTPLSCIRDCRSALLVALLLCGCDQPAVQTVERTQLLMDTAVTLKIFLPDRTAAARAAAALDSAFAELAHLEATLSSYRIDSEVSSVNRNAGAHAVAISATLDSLVRAARWVSTVSEGAFDITIAPLLHAWGFGTDSLKLPARAAITSRLPLVNFRHLQLRQETRPRPHTSSDANLTLLRFEQPGMAIDLGGIAKGYAVDVVAARLTRDGFQDFLLAAGGDLHLAASPLTAGQRYVWIKHPRKPGEFFARFHCDHGGVSTSGDYERFFEQDGKRYHHLLDPATGYPAGLEARTEQTVSVTVVANTTTHSDALATAFFVMGSTRGFALAEQMPEVEAVFVYLAANQLHWRATRGLAAELEILNTEL